MTAHEALPAVTAQEINTFLFAVGQGTKPGPKPMDWMAVRFTLHHCRRVVSNMAEYIPVEKDSGLQEIGPNRGTILCSTKEGPPFGQCSRRPLALVANTCNVLLAGRLIIHFCLWHRQRGKDRAGTRQNHTTGDAPSKLGTLGCLLRGLCAGEADASTQVDQLLSIVLHLASGDGRPRVDP